MKYLFLSLFIFMLSISLLAQSNDAKDRAVYVLANLQTTLQDNTTYSLEAMRKRAQGDVVVSFVIDENGKMDKMRVRSSPDISLAKIAVDAMMTLDSMGWKPAIENGQPVTKDYMIGFQFRQDSKSSEPNYEKQIEKNIEKGKLDKALNICNKAIADLSFDSELFRLRAKIKYMLEDRDGSNADALTARNLDAKLLAVVPVRFYTVTTTRVISGSDF